ncbi:MAG: dependent oxidoreductase [Actinomycetia bacterium]|nr:dependent oxidoreductase [Actinomycetes bacterium]
MLADAGWSVLVCEAEGEPGGAVRSGELIEPGFVHDRFSAFFPLAAASPVFRALGIELPFRHGPLVLAHPALDGSCAVLSRDEPWPELAAVWERLEPAVLRGMTTPFPQVRAALQALPALRPVRIEGELRRRLVLGNTLHSDLPPHSLLGRAFGLMLTAFAQRHGYPCIEGGSGRITDALVTRARERGVELRFGERVDRLPHARRAVLAAVDIWELGRILGRSFGIEPDPATVKVDWTLDGPVPWAAPDARRSPVVHLGDERSFVLFGQYSMADPSRAPAGKETAWAYTHVLPDAEAIEAVVERYAPGFRALIRGRHVQLLPPGRVNGGTSRRQLVFRPRFGRPTITDGVYLASMSAHPGGGVHGAPGWIAAQAALRSASRRRARGLASFTISSR